ncbi:TraX family protein [Peptoniphilus asaccharolyticus]
MKKDLFSSSTLKIIAMVCMLIDHVAAGIVNNGFYDVTLLGMNSSEISHIMRSIGRIAFPIFLFLLIEGFNRTRDVKKYILRLLIFAFISEIPFNMALRGSVFDISSQNVYFELFLILAMLYCLKTFEDKFKGFSKILVRFIIIGAFALISEVIKADYGVYGIVAAAIMYAFSSSREARALSIIPAFAFEMFMPAVFLASPLVYFYNGKRGINLKYVFYAFYPLHLILIGIIRMNLL